MRFWLPFAFLLGTTALSVLLLDPLGPGPCVAIFGLGVVTFVVSLVRGAQAEQAPRGHAVYFGVSERAEMPVVSLIDCNGDPSLCRLRAAPRVLTPWRSIGLELAEPRLLETLARGVGLAAVSNADRVRLAHTIAWLSANSGAELTFEMTGEHQDPADEIEISGSELAASSLRGKPQRTSGTW